MSHVQEAVHALLNVYSEMDRYMRHVSDASSARHPQHKAFATKRRADEQLTWLTVPLAVPSAFTDCTSQFQD